MDVTLGPWKAEMSVDEKERKPLTEAMANEAWNKAKSAGFTPKKAEGSPAKKGFTISGKLTHVVTKGKDTTVKALYQLWIDDSFTNVPAVAGDATATAPMTAEDALRAVTESRVGKLLDVIKSGRAKKAS